jgi:hypothetical protein
LVRDVWKKRQPSSKSLNCLQSSYRERIAVKEIFALDVSWQSEGAHHLSTDGKRSIISPTDFPRCGPLPIRVNRFALTFFADKLKRCESSESFQPLAEVVGGDEFVEMPNELVGWLANIPYILRSNNRTYL